VLHIQRRNRWTARIALSAPATEARHLLIEIPRSGDATLLPEDDIKSAEETATAWRLPLTLKPGEQRTLVVRVDRPEREDVELLQDSGTVAAILNEQTLTPQARAALRHIEDSRATLATKQADQARIKAQIADTEHDEDRLRRNIATVPAADALHGKLVRALEADEEKLSSLTAAAAQAEAATTQAQTALEEAVGSLRLDK
jgi:hypothetical protein